MMDKIMGFANNVLLARIMSSTMTRPPTNPVYLVSQEQGMLQDAIERELDPEIAFRDYIDPDDPSSGAFIPATGECLLWSIRLGLPHPKEWNGMSKEWLRSSAARWNLIYRGSDIEVNHDQ